MFDVNIFSGTLVPFIGTLLALVSAGILWIFKSAYEKHQQETLVLAKLERSFVMNIRYLEDNLEFMNEWIRALGNNRPFSFYIQHPIVSEEDTFKLSDLKLINLILPTNYKMQRMTVDLENVYKSYWENIYKIDAIQDEVRKNQNLIHFHNTIKEVLEQMKVNYEPVKEHVIDIIARIRARAYVRYHSLYGYLSFLYIDIFPRVTKKLIKRESKKLKDNLDKLNPAKPGGI